MFIPKIIHQTWRDRRIPAAFQRYVDSWKQRHPDWEYRLWTDRDNRRFIKRHYRWFLAQYDAYRWPIQRADAVRYFILHRHGGLYVDLDFQCLKPLDALLEGKQCVLGLEPHQHCLDHCQEQIVSNALMAAAPGHPFFGAVIDQLPKYAERVNTVQPILETTGPFMLSHVYADFSARHTIHLVPSKYLFPLSMDQADACRKSRRAPGNLDEAYAIHFHVGTWWRAEHLQRDGIRSIRCRPRRWRRRLKRVVVGGTAAVLVASLLAWLFCDVTLARARSSPNPDSSSR